MARRTWYNGYTIIIVGDLYMQLDYEQYLEKVKSCWLGKNIGRTLGAPLEGKCGVFDVDYYIYSNPSTGSRKSL